MFNMSLLLVVVLVTCCETLCSEQESTTPAPSTVNSTEALARVNQGSIALTGEFLYQLLKSTPNSNVVASATSVLIPLAQLAYFATGLVLEQLLKVLNLHNKDEIKSAFQILLADYENQTQVIFEIKNKFYANINYPLSPEFKEFSQDIFQSGGQNIDFGDNVAAAKTINDWVAESTHDKITDLVTPDMFSSDTRLVLCNAIYFLGNWLHQFNPNKTETKDFYLDDTNTVKLPIMYQETGFNYYEDDGMKIQALEMPYKNSNFSFLVILPRAIGTEAVLTVADQLRNPATFTGILDNMSYQKVQVSLPRMKISLSLNAAKILKEANVTEMFKSNSNGFSGILERPEPIFVSDAIQKAFISVDETGTEAAAATAIGIRPLSLPLNPPPVYVFNANPISAVTAAASIYFPQIYKFDADHPSLFYILYQRIPVFCGGFLGNK